MPGYTKVRTEEIHAAAKSLVAAVGGVEVLDAMTDLDARRSILVGLAKQLSTNESITYKTAHAHIAKACRRMRKPPLKAQQSPNWGGARDGAGRKQMSKPNPATYHARVQNESGAGEHAGSDSNLTKLKATIRNKYGKGWTVIIDKVEHDGDSGWFPPVEIERFTLRG